VSSQSDTSLRDLLRTDPEQGWRRFLDQYTPLILGLLRRGGLDDRDEVMEVYVRLCEQLAARDFERLKQQDAARGSVGGWLAVLVRHTIVDWVRSRKGRRRLFRAVQALPAFDRRVFELYYWEDRTPTEIAELLATGAEGRPALGGVLDALHRIQAVLTDGHRADLLASAARSKAPLPLDTDTIAAVTDPSPDAEASLAMTQLNAALETALAGLPAQDAVIVRLKFVEGLSNRDIERTLNIRVTAARLDAILETLRSALSGAGAV
jgi:DNA-directed RNA polymerase specialized sigma24 family protein